MNETTTARAKAIRLQMSEEEAAHVLRYLGDCCTDELLADVYYRLQALVQRREPKRFNVHAKGARGR